jgi:outer membrane protein, heavy metal efflux system
MAMASSFLGCQSAIPVRTTGRLDNPSKRDGTPENSISQVAHSETVAAIPVINLAVGEDVMSQAEMAIPETLTLPEIEAMALENSPALGVDGARVHAAYGRQLQASLYPNPVLGYHANEVGNLGTAGAQGGFIRQKIVTGDKIRLDTAVARNGVQAAEYRFETQRRRVINDVRTRFYGVLVAQRRVKLTQELSGVGDKFAESSRNLLKAKQATENDLLQAEIEAESAHILSDNAKNELTESLRRLAAAAGVKQLESKSFSGNLQEETPNFDWQNSYATVLGTSPELDAARATVDRARTAVQRARREVIPDVDVFVSVRHHDVTSDDVANIKIGIPIPIFDRNQGNIQQARAQLIAAEHTVQRIELDLQDRLAVAYRRYTNARQQVQRYSQNILPRSKESLNLVKTGYDKQQVNFLTLLTAQRTYYKTSLAHLDAVWELRQAAITIEGQLLTGSLSKR